MPAMRDAQSGDHTTARLRSAAPAELVLTIEEAAVHLGCSVSTVRRRIRDGSLYAEKVPGQFHPVWRVMVSGVTTTTITQSGDHSDQDSRAGQSDAQVAALQILGELAALRREIAALAGLPAEIAALRQQIAELAASGRPSLEAPKEIPSDPSRDFPVQSAGIGATGDGSTNAEKTNTGAGIRLSDPPRRPWWQFWK